MTSRNVLNLVVDGLSFTGFLFLASTGAILHYLLLPGSGHWQSLWGMTRHEWGDAHFSIAVVLLVVLSVHVLLHWGWIVAVVRGKSCDRSGARLLLGIVGALVLVLIAVAPLLSPVEVSEATGGRRRQQQVQEP